MTVKMTMMTKRTTTTTTTTTIKFAKSLSFAKRNNHWQSTSGLLVPTGTSRYSHSVQLAEIPTPSRTRVTRVTRVRFSTAPPCGIPRLQGLQGSHELVRNFASRISYFLSGPALGMTCCSVVYDCGRFRM